LGGWSSDASGLNNSNVVIGMADDADQVSRAFTWRNGIMSPLRFTATGGGSWTITSLLRITDDGRIFGTGALQGTNHAVQLSSGVGDVYDLVDLGTLPGRASSLNGFNRFGSACGEGEFYPPSQVEAFLVGNGTSTLLGNLGSPGSYAMSINDLGDVVGSSNSRSYRAFLWREGSLYDLNSCIPTNSGWVLVDADGINNAGQIVGHSMVGSSHHAFLLDPVPGSGQGLTIVLEGTSNPNQWRVRLARQPSLSVGFQVSTDLSNWAPVDYLKDGDTYLVEGGDNLGPGFFRAVFKP
jgi:probable HAF family extracellular repeat protein